MSRRQIQLAGQVFNQRSACHTWKLHDEVAQNPTSSGANCQKMRSDLVLSAHWIPRHPRFVAGLRAHFLLTELCVDHSSLTYVLLDIYIVIYTHFIIYTHSIYYTIVIYEYHCTLHCIYNIHTYIYIYPCYSMLGWPCMILHVGATTHNSTWCSKGATLATMCECVCDPTSLWHRQRHNFPTLGSSQRHALNSEKLELRTSADKSLTFLTKSTFARLPFEKLRRGALWPSCQPRSPAGKKCWRALQAPRASHLSCWHFVSRKNQLAASWVW